jgi:hypothetical protein
MLSVWNRALLSVVLVCGPSLTIAGDVTLTFSSGERRVNLVELFTSEGCSSCPPADRWLSRLKADPGLWADLIPISFHVDYWDYIGWQDRFAKAAFGDRQERYAREGGARFVYTPGFFLNGYEWQGWRSSETVAIDAIDDSLAGELTVRISGNDIVVQFDAPHENYGEMVIHVALLGMDLETFVRAGENKGKSLRHDFVTLGIVSARLNEVGNTYKVTVQLPETSLNPPEQAIVAWVSDNKVQMPIQSTGGLLISP